MNAKIPLRKFAETLSVKSGISITEAENFIKLVFGIASEELRTGSTVRIKGLGAFSLSRDEADPVYFEPDKNFAAAINSPFAIFAPVELAAGVTDEMLSDIDKSAEKDAAVQEATENDIEIANAEVASIPVEETENEDIQTVSETDVCDEAVTDEESAPTEVSDVETVITDETGTKEEPVSESVSEAEIEEPAEAAAEVEESPETEETEATPESVAPDWEYEEEEYVQQPERNESRFGAGFVAGLIVGLAIGALALCAYVMYYVNSTPENQSIDTELIETALEPIA